MALMPRSKRDVQCPWTGRTLWLGRVEWGNDRAARLRSLQPPAAAAQCAARSTPSRAALFSLLLELPLDLQLVVARFLENPKDCAALCLAVPRGLGLTALRELRQYKDILVSVALRVATGELVIDASVLRWYLYALDIDFTEEGCKWLNIMADAMGSTDRIVTRRGQDWKLSYGQSPVSGTAPGRFTVWQLSTGFVGTGSGAGQHGSARLRNDASGGIFLNDMCGKLIDARWSFLATAGMGSTVVRTRQDALELRQRMHNALLTRHRRVRVCLDGGIIDQRIADLEYSRVGSRWLLGVLE